MSHYEEKIEQLGKEMSNHYYSTTVVVDQPLKEVFNAINNVRGWWSEEIEGRTDKLGGVFAYHYKDVHYCKMKIIEFIPNKKVVWHVLDNYFAFTKDKSEWIDTKIIFEVMAKGNKTEVHFTHVGLVSKYECYDICYNAWNGYINGSLRDLITTGKGNPTPKEFADNLIELKINPENNINFNTSFRVDQTPEEVFNAINNVRGWWAGLWDGTIDGDSFKLGDEFIYQVPDVHYSKQKIIQFFPNKKVVWLVIDANLSFTLDKTEWKGTKISFEISEKHNQTELNFTHFGLVSAFECYDNCSYAWNMLINSNLKNLIIHTTNSRNKNIEKST